MEAFFIDIANLLQIQFYLTSELTKKQSIPLLFKT